MSKHRRYQPRIVDAPAGYLVIGNELAPVRKDRRCLFEEWKLSEELINFLSHRRDRPAKAIGFAWTACNRPELNQILRRQIDRITTRKQRGQALTASA